MTLSVIFPKFNTSITTDKIANHSFALKGNWHFVIPTTLNNEGDLGNSFLVTASTGLNVTVNAGQAIVGGYYVEETSSTTLSVYQNTTSYIYVQIVTVADRATSAQYVVSTNSNLQDRKTMLIAQVTASSSSVTSIVDRRNPAFYIRTFYIETSTSTTLTFNGARGVYAFFEGLGGGGGGGKILLQNYYFARGGIGGGYGRNERVIPNCTKIEIQVGAGGAGATSAGGYGGDGGDSVVTFRDSNNTMLAQFVAPKGYLGAVVNIGSDPRAQEYNWYDITPPSFHVVNSVKGGWYYYYDYKPESYSLFARSIYFYNYNFSGVNIRTFYGGGTGACVLYNNGTTTSSPQTSAIEWGGSGGASGGSGSFPAGGGGAGSSSSNGGSGAGGQVRLYLLVFY